jgi:hypothetical protein
VVLRQKLWQQHCLLWLVTLLPLLLLLLARPRQASHACSSSSCKAQRHWPTS